MASRWRRQPRDLDFHENVLRKWVREAEADPQSAFPGNGQMKPEQQEIERLRRELARMNAAASSQRGKMRRRLFDALGQITLCNDATILASVTNKPSLTIRYRKY